MRDRCFFFFITDANLNFGCKRKGSHFVCTKAVAKARSDYVHAILWAANCRAEFPNNFRETLTLPDR
jgi:hypothetical protein